MYITVEHDPQLMVTKDRSTGFLWMHYKFSVVCWEKMDGPFVCRTLRRYNDFLWLSKVLAETIPGAVLPVLPEKDMRTKIASDKINKKFLSLRARALNSYLQALAHNSSEALCEKQSVRRLVVVFVKGSEDEWARLMERYKLKVCTRTKRECAIRDQQPTTRHTPIARPRTQYSTDEQIEKLAEKAAKVRRSSHAQEKEREKDEKDEKPKKTSMFKAFSARVSSKVTAFVEDSIIWEPKFNALVAEESDDDKAINKIIAMCNQKSYAREYIITNR